MGEKTAHIKKKRGRKPFTPTRKQRETVSMLAGCGVSLETICRLPEFNINISTLKKYFQREIDNGKEISNGAVLKSAFRQAISGKVPAMTMFWLKCRARWREVHEEKHENLRPFEIRILGPEESKPPDEAPAAPLLLDDPQA